MPSSTSDVLRDTADIRRKLLEIWKAVDAKQISSTEARLHISLARAVLETMKVEIAAAHLASRSIPAVPTIGLPAPRERVREQ